MSRFTDDYEVNYANQGELWWANVQRALSGKAGQQALRDLEAALLALPEPVLISSHLAHNGQVCTMGALALYRRTAAGQPREAVLADLERAIPYRCYCGHTDAIHVAGTGPCCAKDRYGAEREGGCGCQAFDHEDPTAFAAVDDITARVGTSVGLTYSLAWFLAYQNDEYHCGDTPEQRYTRVLEWTRAAQRGPVVA